MKQYIFHLERISALLRFCSLKMCAGHLLEPVHGTLTSFWKEFNCIQQRMKPCICSKSCITEMWRLWSFMSTDQLLKMFQHGQ